MRSVHGKLTLLANTPIQIFSIPVSELHNVAVKAAGSLALGGSEIETTKGLGMENGDIAAWSWQDFRQDEKGNFTLFAVAPAQTTLSFLIWRR